MICGKSVILVILRAAAVETQLCCFKKQNQRWSDREREPERLWAQRVTVVTVIGHQHELREGATVYSCLALAMVE